MSRILPIVALLLALPIAAPADEIPDGRRGVRHEIYFEGFDQDAFAGRRLVLYPTHVDGAWLEVTAGKPAEFYRILKPCLYVVDGEIPEDQAARKAFFETLPRSTPIERVATVSEADPTARIVTVYRLVGVEGRTLTIEKAKVDSYDDAGHSLQPRQNTLLPTLLGTSAMAVAFLAVRFARRRGIQA